MEDLKEKVIRAISNLVSKEAVTEDDTNRLSVLSGLLSFIMKKD